MTNQQQRQNEELVKTSLFQFINMHIPGADLKIVDEIVLSYVISILEEASEGEEAFDVEGFIEMMSAYFPEFASISSGVVCTWIFQLENQLSQLNAAAAAATNEPETLSLNSLSLSDIIPEEKLRGARTTSVSSSGGGCGGTEVIEPPAPAKRVQLISETSDGGSTDSSNCDLFAEECDVLQEMFPESSFIEVKHCVTIANGDINKATQILLHRQETGQSLHVNSLTQSSRAPAVNDDELKNRIIARYSYVDKTEKVREYKPVVPKVEPKKLVRYRDNKIVSLKGERYTEVRRNGDDEAELKKPKKPICP